MSELFQQWLDARFSVPGMIACAVAAPDATGSCRSTDANFSVEQMGEVVQLLQETPPLPGAKPEEIRWHTWVFTSGKIRAVKRPDGWLFAAAVRTNSDAAQILDPLSEEFIALKAG
jgi:hypothetical protein